MRIVDGKEATSFWDIEKPRFTLAKGPAWLRLDEKTGVLSGVPDTAGTAEIVVRVSLERTVRRLDDATALDEPFDEPLDDPASFGSLTPLRRAV